MNDEQALGSGLRLIPITQYLGQRVPLIHPLTENQKARSALIPEAISLAFSRISLTSSRLPSNQIVGVLPFDSTPEIMQLWSVEVVS
ncbi:MAG: hypothetical protein AAGE61_03515 [Pseudomonadota bacterium]